MLRLVFHLALRQAEGLAASVLRLLGQALRVPDHTTLCRRGRAFAGQRPEIVPHGPMHLVINRKGLKLFGRGEWDEKHGRAYLSWRKLHIAVDADTGEIASTTADGAYDGEPVYQAVASRRPDPPPDVVIPPRASAVPSTEYADARSPRDRHIRLIAQKGRMAWQRATGYGRRSLAETVVRHFQAIIGPRLHARTLSARQGEAAIAVRALNHMIRVAKLVSVRIA